MNDVISDASTPVTPGRRSTSELLLMAAAVVALLVTVGLRVQAVNEMSGPIINADEAGYLVNARAIGAGQPASSTQYYPGYSAIISAGFVADGAAPVANYRGVLAVNVALAVVGIGAAAMVAQRVRPQLGLATSLLIGATVSALPSWISYSPLAMSENALIPGMFVMALLATKPFQLRHPATLAGIGLAAGLIWSFHPRALAVPIGYSVVGLVVLFRHRRALVSLLAGVGSGLVATVLFRGLVEGWNKAEAVAGPDDYTAAGLLTRLTEDGEFGALVGTAAGQTAYILAAGSIFILAGLLGMMPAVRRLIAGDHDGMDQVRVAAAITLLLTVGLSIAFWAGRPARADGVIYGRYSEPAALVVIAVGLISVLAMPHDRAAQRRLVMMGASVAAVSAVLIVAARYLVPESIRSGIAVSVNIPAVLAYMPTAHVSFQRMLVVTVLTAVAVTIAAVIRPRLALGAVLVAAVSVHAFVLLPDKVNESGYRADQRLVADAVLEHFGNEECVTYDRASFLGWHFFNYEYFLDGAGLERFRSTADEAPCGDLVISGRRDLQLDFPGARLLMLENHAPQDLWVLPAAQAQVQDLLFPEDPSAALPAEALVAGIELSQPLSDGEFRAELRVDVTHNGTGSPWPNRVGLRTVEGFVQLGARWFDSDGQLVAVTVADLDQTLLPGESTRVDFDDFAAVDLQPGPYRVEVDLVQQGVIWFADAGSQPVVLELELP